MAAAVLSGNIFELGTGGNASPGGGGGNVGNAGNGNIILPLLERIHPLISLGSGAGVAPSPPHSECGTQNPQVRSRVNLSRH